MLPGLLLLSDQVPICWRYLLQEACFEWCVSFFSFDISVQDIKAQDLLIN